MDTTDLPELTLAGLAGQDGPDRLVADLALTGTVPLGSRVRKAFLRRVDALPTRGRELLLVAAAEETGHTDTVLGACGRLGIPADALVEVERSGLLEVADAELRFREIGERLHLSPRTVGSHLYRMFPKLGFSSRAQLRGLDFD